jgi:hypothetical protein
MADQRIERLKEQIKYETEILKALILVAFATVGGSASLLLGAATQARAVLVGIGLLIALAAVVGIGRQDRTIRALIARIEENGP